MYLCQAHKETGLINLEEDYDGFYAVKEFRDLLNSENGLQKFTVVALVVDYLSPVRNFNDKERPLKAIDTVFHDRKAINWFDSEMQEAAIKYAELQIDLDVEEKKILDNMRSTQLDNIKNAVDTSEKLRLLAELSKINKTIDEFNKKNANRDLFSGSPVRNGYTLSRLEQKLEDRKSFYNDEKKRNQPAVEGPIKLNG